MFVGTFEGALVGKFVGQLDETSELLGVSLVEFEGGFDDITDGGLLGILVGEITARWST